MLILRMRHLSFANVRVRSCSIFWPATLRSTTPSIQRHLTWIIVALYTTEKGIHVPFSSHNETLLATFFCLDVKFVSSISVALRPSAFGFTVWGWSDWLFCCRVVVLMMMPSWKFQNGDWIQLSESKTSPIEKDKTNKELLAISLPSKDDLVNCQFSEVLK